jgi:hypothetical protein
MNRVAQELDKTRIALLGEAVDPGEDIRKSIEDELAQIGGVALN